MRMLGVRTVQRGAPAVYASKALGQASRVHWHPPNTRLCLALHQEPRSDNLWSASPPLHAAEASAGLRNVCAAAATLERSPQLVYELIQGALVRWTELTSAARPPPTAVLIHGILGSRKNMQSFARRITQAFPSWQILLVDLRCHGESARHLKRPSGPHGVDTAAGDVLRLLGRLKLFPELLIGHSFGGKVVMSMAEQFGRRGSRLPRPVKVWVLDALPGDIRAGGEGRKDHPADVIAALQALPLPIRDRTAVQAYLLGRGFSDSIAKWISTNLRPLSDMQRELVWSFDLDGIAQMYQSYENTTLWPFLREPQDGIEVNFVKAEQSVFRWGGDDEALIRSYGHRVLPLAAGHWVHTDNPAGLLDLLVPSFEGTAAVAKAAETA